MTLLPEVFILGLLGAVLLAQGALWYKMGKVETKLHFHQLHHQEAGDD